MGQTDGGGFLLGEDEFWSIKKNSAAIGSDILVQPGQSCCKITDLLAVTDARPEPMVHRYEDIPSRFEKGNAGRCMSGKHTLVAAFPAASVNEDDDGAVLAGLWVDVQALFAACSLEVRHIEACSKFASTGSPPECCWRSTRCTCCR